MTWPNTRKIENCEIVVCRCSVVTHECIVIMWLKKNEACVYMGNRGID